jgi:hypothetical protein
MDGSVPGRKKEKASGVSVYVMGGLLSKLSCVFLLFH